MGRTDGGRGRRQENSEIHRFAEQLSSISIHNAGVKLAIIPIIRGIEDPQVIGTLVLVKFDPKKG